MQPNRDLQDGKTAEHPALATVYLARQPIVDRQLRTVGYELLYSEDPAATDVVDPPARATSRVLANLLLEFGVDQVVGGFPAWVGFPESYFSEPAPMPIPLDALVVEVNHDLRLTDANLRVLRDWVEQGHELALDHFEWRPGLQPLLELARYVKVDVGHQTAEELARLIDRHRCPKVSFVAEQVENMGGFELCSKAGFEYFQGYFMMKPEVLEQTTPSANRLALLRLLAELNAEDVAVKSIESLVLLDVTLSYRLLRCLNSSLYALPRKVESIKQALVMLGITRVRNLVTLLVLGSMSDRPSELLTTALVRARTLELVARHDPKLNPDSAFAAGLLSVLDALFERPMDQILANVPLTETLRLALTKRHGDYGRLLCGMEAHERGDIRRVLETRLDPVTLVRCWLLAIDWAGSMRQLLSEIGAPAPARQQAPGQCAVGHRHRL
jgi:EAL and modified HD-GYP domain-containing signal transduction protein